MILTLWNMHLSPKFMCNWAGPVCRPICWLTGSLSWPLIFRNFILENDYSRSGGSCGLNYLRILGADKKGSFKTKMTSEVFKSVRCSTANRYAVLLTIKLSYVFPRSETRALKSAQSAVLRTYSRLKSYPFHEFLGHKRLEECKHSVSQRTFVDVPETLEAAWHLALWRHQNCSMSSDWSLYTIGQYTCMPMFVA